VNNEKEKILFVGQHPEGNTGNGNMMQACLDQINYSKYNVKVFAQGEPPIELTRDIFEENNTPYELIPAFHRDTNDSWGKQKLLAFLETANLDQLIFVGIDIWRYAEIFPRIKQISLQNEFAWKVLVPYDAFNIRHDWINWLKYPDKTYIYSKYGYDMVKDHVPNAEYFRPSLLYKDILEPAMTEEKKDLRSKIFPDVTEDITILGFIGNNQLRKNILKLLWGFSTVLQDRKDVVLYIHTNNPNNVYNIQQLVRDFDLPDASVRHNGASRPLLPEEMSVIYKCLDAHILPSIQEGLSWTVIESKLAGLPSIISRCTAHLDYENEDSIFFIDCDETDYLPLMTEEGPAYVPTLSCSPTSIADAIDAFLASKDHAEIDYLQSTAIEFGKEWTEMCDDISKILESTVSQRQITGEII